MLVLKLSFLMAKVLLDGNFMQIINQLKMRLITIRGMMFDTHLKSMYFIIKIVLLPDLVESFDY